MGKKSISGVISLKDNMSASLRGIQKEHTKFQRELKKTRKEKEKADKEFKKQLKVRLDATAAHKKIQKLSKKMAPLRKKIISAIILKDNASNKIKKVTSGLKRISKMVAKPAIIPRDMATKVINKTMAGFSKLKSGGKFALNLTGAPAVMSAITKVGSALKGVAAMASIPLGIVGAGAGMALKEGSMLEQQQVSMKHFMGIGNKGKSDAEVQKMSNTFLKDLRNNANATPFETGEVISAGTRALQISGGNTKEAMKKVKLAEDMAALNPGKTISDAMEALADMEMGEYARLTEFGVKATKENGDTPSSVQGKLEGMYTGGAEKLASTGQGKLSTITGKLKSSMADTGLVMIEALKPALDGMIGFIDQMAPKMEGFGKMIGTSISGVVSFLTENMPTIKATIEPIITGIGSVVSAVLPLIGQAFEALKPIFIGVGTLIGAVMQNISVAVKTAVPIVSNLIKNLSPVFQIVGSTLQILGHTFKNTFSGVMSIVKKAYDFVKPLIDGIGGMLSGVANGVKSVANFITGGGSKSKGKKKKNATGTRYFSGGVSLVGEHGPELVQMPGGSKVYTNRETKGMLNQGSNININISNVTISENADAKRVAREFVKEINRSLAGGVN